MGFRTPTLVAGGRRQRGILIGGMMTTTRRAPHDEGVRGSNVCA